MSQSRDTSAVNSLNQTGSPEIENIPMLPSDSNGAHSESNSSSKLVDKKDAFNGDKDNSVQEGTELNDLKESDEGVEIGRATSNPGEEVDPDTVCGIFNFKPKWIQKYATSKVFLFFYSNIGVITGIYYAYRIGIISTLEKRYAFKSKTSAMIMTIDELTPLVLGPLIGYLGGKTHRPRLFGVGLIFSILCCLVSAFPYAIYGSDSNLDTLKLQNKSDREMCDDSPKENCEPDEVDPTFVAVFFFMLAGFLKGFGNLAYHSIGLSYLDDNTKKGNTPMYFSITFALRMMGPLLGFLLVSVCLKYYENPFEDPGYGPEDPRWIGCWWLGYVIQGVVLIFFTIPIIFFPRRLPGYKDPTTNADDEMNFKEKIIGLYTALKRLLKNPLFMTLTLNFVLNIYGNVGHFVMLPKYMESQFRLTASDASLYSGPPGIATSMASFILGGYLMWRYKPNVRLLTFLMAILEIVGAIGFLFLMIPKCDPVQMSNYGTNENGLILDSSCNFNCNCTTKEFTPICSPDGRTVYFSPCYAGCQEGINKTYSECSCDKNSTTNKDAVFTDGFCVSETCWSQAVAYIITLPILQFVVSMLRIAHTIMLLRVIREEDKSVALGTFEALICLFGFIPYVMISGSLVDSACIIWEKTCGETGNCWFYDTNKFSFLIHGVSATFALLSGISLFVVYFLVKGMSNIFEDEEEEYKSRKIQVQAQENK